jgi:membrane protein required for colicin V production
VIEVAPLTGWDWFVAAALLVSTILGLLSGLVRTVFALAGWVVALLGAPIATPILLDATGWDLHPFFVMVVLFFALLVAVRLIGAALARALSSIGLGGVDRLLGAVLGVARALLIIAVVAAAARWLGADEKPSWQQALTRPLLERLVAFVEPLLPAPRHTPTGRVRQA